MKKIIIIGANEFQNPLIIKAQEMGYETHVFAWKSGDIGEQTADYFYPINIVEKEKILEICKKIRPSAVVSIASDLATITVNYVARGLGLTCNSVKNDYYSTNKFLMRKAFKKAGVNVPEFICTDAELDLEKISNVLKFPVIVKPTDRSGSRGVTKVERIDDIIKAVNRAVSESFEKKAIIEEEIKGTEYSCECISFRGKHHILAFTQKYTTGAPNYIEKGHIQPAVFPKHIEENIKKEIFRALDAIEVEFGASHSEFRIDDEGNMKIIEIGARMGGDCIGSDLVPISTGNDFMKMVIESAEGIEPQIYEPESKVSAIRFIFSKSDQIILENLVKKSELTCIRKELKPITSQLVSDSSKRFGFYIFECKDRKTAEKIMELK